MTAKTAMADSFGSTDIVQHLLGLTDPDFYDYVWDNVSKPADSRMWLALLDDAVIEHTRVALMMVVNQARINLIRKADNPRTPEYLMWRRKTEKRQQHARSRLALVQSEIMSRRYCVAQRGRFLATMVKALAMAIERHQVAVLDDDPNALPLPADNELWSLLDDLGLAMGPEAEPVSLAELVQHCWSEPTEDSDVSRERLATIRNLAGHYEMGEK